MNAKRITDYSRLVTSFYLRLVGIWPHANPEEERKRRNAFRFTIASIVIGLSCEFREMYYAYGNSIADTVFVLCNMVTGILILCKVLALHVSKPVFFELVAYMEKKFWHTNYDTYEKMLMKQCIQICTMFIIFFNVFAQGTAVSYTVEPLVVYFGGNVSARMHLFNLHSAVAMKPIIFELILLSQIFVVVACGIGYIAVDNFICIANFHLSTQFRILQHRLLNAHTVNKIETHSGTKTELPVYYTDNFYTVFKDCIDQHKKLIKFSEKIEEVFTYAILGQILLFSMTICLDGYLMLLDGSSSYRRVSFVFHLIGTLSQLLMFTYSCDCVLRESMEIADSAYGATWPNLPMSTNGKMMRTDLQVIMVRSRVPCCLTAGGFFVVSLETYTKVLSTAASYFTLLRQY